MTYSPPTGPELRALMRRWQLTGGGVAELVCCNARTVRKWTSHQSSWTDNARPQRIPFAPLFVLAAIKEGVQIRPEHWREMLQPGDER